MEQALLWRQWSERITLFRHTGPEPTEDERERLAARGVTVVEGEVAGLRVEDDRLTGVVLTGGRFVPVRALAVAPLFTARADVLAGLDLKVSEVEMHGHVMGTQVTVDGSGATDVPGVWAAGNVAGVAEVVIGSVAAATRAAGAINADLIAEDTREAVAAYRAPFSPAAEREVTERVLGDRRHGLTP
ncbi:hypothetical protein [Thermocatellispora tengchongensis]|uniref:hypothetical protein n=1 Tax=Thermocatellispora tengchongensis TaxID=1073253 RepID=UPI0036449ECC